MPAAPVASWSGLPACWYRPRHAGSLRGPPAREPASLVVGDAFHVAMNLRVKKRLDYYVGGALIALSKPLVMLAGRILQRDHDPRPRGEILVLKLLGGGSLLIAAPALLGIKRAHPACRLSLMTTPAVAPFAELLGVFDRIYLLDDRSFLRMLASAARCWSRTLGVDTVIDLEVYSRLSTVFSALTLARNRIGFYLEVVFWRRNLHTHLLFFNRFSRVHVFYEHVARLLGATPVTREECAELVRCKLPRVTHGSETGRRIAIGHACSDLGRERMLSPRQWRLVLERMPKLEGAEVHLLGGAADRAHADAIIEACSERLSGDTWHNHCGILTLAESVALLATCEAFLGIDSALLHVARLLAIPTTSFWGPTDPATLLQPFPDVTDGIHYRKIPCSPCVHVTEEPPCGGNNLCIATLIEPPPEDVAPMWVIDS
jgi:ADP-heptose:LPS heptosyltransferase